jgi:hypothetical protein
MPRAQMTDNEWRVWRQRRPLYEYDNDEAALYDVQGCFMACSHAKRIEMLNYLLGEFGIDPSELTPRAK